MADDILPDEEPAAEAPEAPAPLPGFYVKKSKKDKDYLSGPYPTDTDAQAFIDGHLDGQGLIEEVSN